jgi:membrane-bound inhibitor of C-type lysozyme
MRPSTFLCCLGALCAAGFGAFAAEEPQPAPLSVRYKCDNKQSLQVDYYNTGKKPRVIVTASKPPKGSKAPPPARSSWTLNQAASGSGARYEDSKKTMEWWNKGNEGTLTDLKTGKTLTCTEFAKSQ